MKKKLVLVVGVPSESKVETKFDPSEGISLREGVEQEMIKRIENKYEVYRKVNEVVRGIYRLTTDVNIRTSTSGKYIIEATPLKELKTKLKELLSTEEYKEFIDTYFDRIFLCIVHNDVKLGKDGKFQDITDLIRIVDYISPKEDKGCGGNCNCHDKPNTLESVIKNQKPRISLGKDLEERLATYNSEIVNGVIQNIVTALDKVDENPTWWTEDKLNAALILGMNIADVPEEAIRDNQEYKEAYSKIINTVGKIKVSLKKAEEAKKIEGKVKIMLEAAIEEIELFSLTYDKKLDDFYKDKMQKALKYKIIEKNRELKPRTIISMIDMTPKFVEAYINVHNNELVANGGIMMVTDLVRSIALKIVE